MYRINQSGQEPVVDVEMVEQFESVVWSLPPNRWHLDQIERDPMASGHTSRRWGVAINRLDGSVEVEPDPWET